MHKRPVSVLVVNDDDIPAVGLPLNADKPSRMKMIDDMTMKIDSMIANIFGAYERSIKHKMVGTVGAVMAVILFAFVMVIYPRLAAGSNSDPASASNNQPLKGTFNSRVWPYEGQLMEAETAADLIDVEAFLIGFASSYKVNCLHASSFHTFTHPNTMVIYENVEDGIGYIVRNVKISEYIGAPTDVTYYSIFNSTQMRIRHFYPEIKIAFTSSLSLSKAFMHQTGLISPFHVTQKILAYCIQSYYQPSES